MYREGLFKVLILKACTVLKLTLYLYSNNKTIDMKIDKNYTVSVANSMVTLRYESDPFENEKGNLTTSTDTWFFPNTAMALKKYVDTVIGSDVSEVEEVLAQIESLYKKIEKLCLKK